MSHPEFNSSESQYDWSKFCDLLWFNKDLGIWLDISKMGVCTDQLIKYEGADTGIAHPIV